MVMLNNINGVVEFEACQAIVDTMILLINMYPASCVVCSFKGLYNGVVEFEALQAIVDTIDPRT